MEFERRNVETQTTCPRCGNRMVMRQTRWISAERTKTDWYDDGKVCLRGCRLTAGEAGG